jgi:hypothetical protein
MTRYLKALGLSVIAVCAMSAVAASGAQAAPEITGCETSGEICTHVHTIVTGTSEEPTAEHPETGVQKFKAGQTVECWHAHFEGTLETGTATSLTLSAKYTGSKTETLGTCETSGLVTHVDMNGCHYRLNAPTNIEPGVYTGTVDIICNTEGKAGPITIKITKSGGEETKCTLKVPAQAGLQHVITRNKSATKPTDITLEATVKEIEYESEGTQINCGVKPGVHKGAEGATYTGNVTVKGFNTAEQQIDLTVNG